MFLGCIIFIPYILLLKTMKAAKEKFLTKDDKMDILNRMDAHFKWLVGIMISAISLATVLGKIL